MKKKIKQACRPTVQQLVRKRALKKFEKAVVVAALRWRKLGESMGLIRDLEDAIDALRNYLAAINFKPPPFRPHQVWYDPRPLRGQLGYVKGAW